MGYSLPAAIGAYFGKRVPVVSFNGDGGFQMNIQELEFVVRENIPVLIVIMNNYSLGMIRHFKEMYFEGRYYHTISDSGYSVPEFSMIASAYGIQSYRIETIEQLNKIEFDFTKPCLIEYCIYDETFVFPKLEFGKPNQDQEPLLDRELYRYLMEL